MAQATRSLLLATTGPNMQVFAADIEAATLEPINCLTLSGNVQYCWPSHDNRMLYVGSTDGGPHVKGSHYELTVLAVDPATGMLRHHGRSVSLPSRPVHLCLDAQGEHVLVAYHRPAGLSVFRIAADGSIDGAVEQEAHLDAGIYPHQILAAPSGRQVVLVTRGNKATAEQAEDPGALKLFDYENGKLRFKASIAPNGGYGFGPRDIDFHPTLPYVYVSLERQNKLHVYGYRNGDLTPEPVYMRENLKEPRHLVQRQVNGPLHLHPDGRTLYVANRGGPYNPADVYIGGEDSIAVFRLDPETGEPTLIQHAGARGARPRTFGIDRSGRMLWTAAVQERIYEEGGKRTILAAGISTFHVASDGTLEFAHRFDIDTTAASLFWSGILTFAI